MFTVAYELRLTPALAGYGIGLAYVIVDFSSGRIEENLCSEDIRADEFVCGEDRTVDVRLGGKIDDHLSLVRHRSEDCIDIANIASDEAVASAV